MHAVREDEILQIPGWVTDLASFRRWVTAEEFPEKVRISHLKGDIWLDWTMEKLVHNSAKSCIFSALYNLASVQKKGKALSDGMRLSHPEAELSTEPDAVYFSYAAAERQRVQLVQGDDSVEVIGSPEMVLEVISRSSVKKDTVILPELYWKAGIDEYWLIDPRGKGLRFDIFRRGPKGYTATRKQGGWLKSQVFGHSFRLLRKETSLGISEFTLEMR